MVCSIQLTWLSGHCLYLSPYINLHWVSALKRKPGNFPARLLFPNVGTDKLGGSSRHLELGPLCQTEHYYVATISRTKQAGKMIFFLNILKNGKGQRKLWYWRFNLYFKVSKKMHLTIDPFKPIVLKRYVSRVQCNCFDLERGGQMVRRELNSTRENGEFCPSFYYLNAWNKPGPSGLQYQCSKVNSSVMLPFCSRR